MQIPDFNEIGVAEFVVQKASKRRLRCQDTFWVTRAIRPINFFTCSCPRFTVQDIFALTQPSLLSRGTRRCDPLRDLGHTPNLPSVRVTRETWDARHRPLLLVARERYSKSNQP
jgi:hypothetical protein